MSRLRRHHRVLCIVRDIVDSPFCRAFAFRETNASLGDFVDCLLCRWSRVPGRSAGFRVASAIGESRAPWSFRNRSRCSRAGSDPTDAVGCGCGLHSAVVLTIGPFAPLALINAICAIVRKAWATANSISSSSSGLVLRWALSIQFRPRVTHPTCRS